jgi:hypothetical protein
MQALSVCSVRMLGGQGHTARVSEVALLKAGVGRTCSHTLALAILHGLQALAALMLSRGWRTLHPEVRLVGFVVKDSLP